MRDSDQESGRPVRGSGSDAAVRAAREAELSAWLAFEPEPPPIPCDAEARAMLGRLGIEIAPEEETLLARYLGMLFATNERINLTRIDRESAWTRHVVDSLTLLAPLASIDGVARAIDVGSGGGLPAIPLAIARRDIEWTLLEATGKKARFLEAVIRRLRLPNARVLNERAEKAARGPLREQFDVATSRAVGALDGLATISVPFLKIGGMMLAIKGERAWEEVAAAKQALYELHAHVVGEVRNETNTIVAIEKQRKTPSKFP
jgi:16S rRNA (guanine527-N7)-methyltransferase